jgi:hypothetical protein
MSQGKTIKVVALMICFLSQEKLLNSVSNDLLPFMVGQSQIVLYTAEFQGCAVISALSAGRSSDLHGGQTGGTRKQALLSSYFFCP